MLIAKNTTVLIALWIGYCSAPKSNFISQRSQSDVSVNPAIGNNYSLIISHQILHISLVLTYKEKSMRSKSSYFNTIWQTIDWLINAQEMDAPIVDSETLAVALQETLSAHYARINGRTQIKWHISNL